MRAVIQRVKEASVVVEGEKIAEIGPGLLVLLGFTDDDTEAMIEKFWQKIKGLRIFPDAEGKTNCDISDIEGNVLLVSQFTLYADMRKGRRPSFIDAAKPAYAEELYDKFVERAKLDFPKLGSGSFGADMKVSLLNDGPFTLILDSDELEKSRRG